MKHRKLNQFKAFIGGYFWEPCPICEEMFGGHEHGGSLMDSWDTAWGTCPDCEEEAGKRNKKWMKDHPHPGYVYHG